MKRLFLVFLLLSLGIGRASGEFTDTSSAFGQSTPSFLPVEQAYQVELIDEGASVTLLWTIADGYYLYRERFSVSLPATDQTAALTVSFEPGKIKHDEYFGETEVYYGSTALHVDGVPGKPGTILTVRSQGCADAGLCYPPRDQFFRRNADGGFVEIDRARADASRTPPGAAPALSGRNPPSPPASTSIGALAVILLSAALGGAILNLMPCVFPILGLKVLSFANAHEGKPVAHGMAYSIGVVVSFIVVAITLIALQNAGQAVGWGFQLQSPWFVALLACLFFALGLNMLGMFEIGGAFMNLGGELSQQRGYRGSFFTGVLATVVASPCTAPFMGTAVGFAATQPALIALSVFAALGIGMALPVLLLTVFPRWLQLLPKPGAWMVTLRQFMAFPLLATAVWLAWIVGRQTGAGGMAAAVIGWLLIGFALWLWQRRPIGRLLAVVSLVAVPVVFATSFGGAAKTETAPGSGFDRAQIERFRENGQAVFLDVTADWCITCAANENLVLKTDAVQQALAATNTQYLIADWTRYDPAITALLADYQRNGVPLYLLFPADTSQDARVLPQILTKSIVLEALNTL